MRRLPSSLVVSTALVVLTSLLYLGCSVHFGFVGFPLDDAWIHQTYARNLAVHHQFAYNPGEPSVGSTSPLWTMLIAPAYGLPLEYRFWTYLLGAVWLALTGWMTYRLASTLFPEDSLTPVLASAFCVLEWHLAWAAFSGMETALFVFLCLLAMERYLTGERPFLTGLVTGLLTLTRPEGVLLLTLLISDTLLRRKRGKETLTWTKTATSVGLLLLGFFILVTPYLMLNLSVTGNLFPNTFYAKQAEYRDLLATLPLWSRWTQVVAVTVVGAQVLLIPGYVYAIYSIVKRRQWQAILPVAWSLVILSTYAIRLPVTYQHGRYLIPAIPILIIYGVWGTKNLPGLPRVVRRVLFVSIPVLLVIFWVRGAEQYAIDVRIIDSELRVAGQWIKANTPPEALIGAHDIGAIGYFSGRLLVDTAGLITPEVVPFITEEAKIMAFLEDRQVDYVVIFPSWYPQMAESPELRAIYRSSSPWILQSGGDNVVVYETAWKE